MSAPQLAALIRCRDEARGIGPLVDRLRTQALGEGLEVIVIDSGSRDGTLAELTGRGIDPLRITPEHFSYGRALNFAAAAARAPVCVAISAHALPPDDGWAQRILGAFSDERVACAFGERVNPALERLERPFLQDLAHAERHPFYGYSNSAGAFRRELWERRPFDEQLRASEDKEWALHWLRQRWLVLLDPALAVHHSHRDEGPLKTFRRTSEDVAAIGALHRLGRQPLRELVAEWWRGPHLHRSALRARLDPRRMAMLAGRHQGLRRASR